MKILVIGDIHGLTIWKDLIKENEFDKVVFLGDYVDSYTISDTQMIQNLRDIIDYKKQNIDNTILLLGNHDIQYIYEGNNCSGRRESYAGIIGDLFKENENLFKVVHEEEGYIFSHAGFTLGWMKENEEILDKYGDTGAESVNNCYLTHDRDILFQCGPSRGGFAKESGPLWADKSDTLNRGQIPNIVQVVGHTRVSSIEDYEDIIFCDNLEYGDKKPLILNIEEGVYQNDI